MGRTIHDKARKRGPVDPKPKRMPANGKPVPVERPKKGPGSGKPNVTMRAKAAGIDTRAIPDPEDAPTITLDHDGTVEKVPGRPTCLTPDLGSRVCSLIAQGLSTGEIEDMDGMPSERTIYRWIAASGEGEKGRLYEAFRQSLTRARTLRAAARASKLERLGQRLTNPKPGDLKLDPAAARVAVEIEQFLMSTEDPGQFGKRVTVAGDKKNPVEVRNRHTLDDATLTAIAAGLDIDNA